MRRAFRVIVTVLYGAASVVLALVIGALASMAALLGFVALLLWAAWILVTLPFERKEARRA